MKFVESPEELVSECEQLAVSQVNGFLRSHPRVPSHEVVRPQLDPPKRSHGVEDVGAVVWGEQGVQEFLDITEKERGGGEGGGECEFGVIRGRSLKG